MLTNAPPESRFRVHRPKARRLRAVAFSGIPATPRTECRRPVLLAARLLDRADRSADSWCPAWRICPGV